MADEGEEKRLRGRKPKYVGPLGAPRLLGIGPLTKGKLSTEEKAEQIFFAIQTSRKIRDELNKRGMPWEEIGIYGSRATMTAGELSDWDFYALIRRDLYFLMSERDILNKNLEISIAVSPRHPGSITCLFGPDRSKCVDFKLTPERPSTGKPLLPE